jgi:broad specificity phosphatase PhoE
VSVRLVLVRHARAAAGWDIHPDPELDDVGRAQALALAATLGSEAARPVVTSPLRRCQETAAPLAAAWHVVPVVDEAVAEIPSPLDVPMEDRVAWLRAAITRGWSDLGPRYTTWRDAVVARLVAFTEPAVVVSHFVAINAVIGAAVGDDRVVIRRLDNCSRTVVEVDGGRLRLVDAGHEADTLIR